MKTKKVIFALMAVCSAVAFVALSFAQPEKEPMPEKSINLVIEISSPLDSVWYRWTSTEGIRKFFAPSAIVEPKPLGQFNIFFTPNAPDGLKGAEGNFVLAVQEKQMFSFTWDAPPQWPEIRKQRTFVAVRFTTR